MTKRNKFWLKWLKQFINQTMKRIDPKYQYIKQQFNYKIKVINISDNLSSRSAYSKTKKKFRTFEKIVAFQKKKILNEHIFSQAIYYLH